MVRRKASPSSRLVRLLRPQVYQFRITMEGVSPEIWRRIQVLSTIGFYALHLAIQDVMGWTNKFAYRFQKFSARPDAKSIRRPLNSGLTSYRKDHLINCYFTRAEDTALYVYHFGSLWKFRVVLEQITLAIDGAVYPLCVSGWRGCPPEDVVGGAKAFKTLSKIVADPNNPLQKKSHVQLMAMGCTDWFHPRSVVFDDELFRDDNET